MGCTHSSHGTESIVKPAPTPGRTDVGPWIKSIDDLEEYPLFPEGKK